MGTLDIGSYTDKNTGEIRQTLDVWANEVTNLIRARTRRLGAIGAHLPRQ